MFPGIRYRYRYYFRGYRRRTDFSEGFPAQINIDNSWIVAFFSFLSSFQLPHRGWILFNGQIN